MALNAVRTQRTFEAISEQIRAQVRSGDLKIGDRLPNERELARTLEVSRHAVRESLRALESVGLIELRKGATGGAFIAEGRPGVVADVMQGMYHAGGISLEQLTEARLWIESVVVRVACARADAAAYAALEENIRRAEVETRAGNLVAKTQLNIQFHMLLAATTGNPVLTMVMGAVMNILREFILREFIGPVGSLMGMDVIHSRRRLLTHMRAGDADKAVAEMERHLKLLHRHYLEVAATCKKSEKTKRSKTHAAKR